MKKQKMWSLRIYVSNQEKAFLEKARGLVPMSPFCKDVIFRSLKKRTIKKGK